MGRGGPGGEGLGWVRQGRVGTVVHLLHLLLQPNLENRSTFVQPLSRLIVVPNLS